jgi:hypothetical protein
VSKFEIALGHYAPKGFHHGVVSKTKWAVRVTEEVKALRHVLNTHCTGIQMLLNLHLLDSVSSLLVMGSSSKAVGADIRELLVGVRNTVEASKTAIENVQRFNHAQLPATRKLSADQVASSRKTAGRQLSRQTVQITTSTRDELSKLEARLAQNLERAVSDIKTTTASRAQSQEIGSMISHNIIINKLNDVATFSQLDGLKPMFHEVVHPKIQDTGFEGVATAGTCPVSETLGSKRNVSALLGRTGSDILELVRAMSDLILLDIVFRFYALLTYWASRCRKPFLLLQQIPRGISQLLNDNIKFTDVLGDSHSLQFEQFRHWDVFLANLHCLFNGRPGEAKVKTGDFRLVSNYPLPKLLTRHNWANYVRPRSEVVMFVAMETLSVPEGRCPRCRANGRPIGKALFICSDSLCELRFSTSFRSRSSKIIQKKSQLASAMTLFSSPEEQYRIRSWLQDVEAGLDAGGAYLESLAGDMSEASRRLKRIPAEEVSTMLKESRRTPLPPTEENLQLNQASETTNKVKQTAAEEASQLEKEELKAFRRIYLPIIKENLQLDQVNGERSDEVHVPGSLSYDPLAPNSRIARTNTAKSESMSKYTS